MTFFGINFTKIAEKAVSTYLKPKYFSLLQTLLLLQESIVTSLLTSFSVKRNGYDLFKDNESSGPLTIFYGMRTFCMMMIVFDHRLATITAGPIINTDFLEKVW